MSMQNLKSNLLHVEVILDARRMHSSWNILIKCQNFDQAAKTKGISTYGKR